MMKKIICCCLLFVSMSMFASDNLSYCNKVHGNDFSSFKVSYRMAGDLVQSVYVGIPFEHQPYMMHIAVQRFGKEGVYYTGSTLAFTFGDSNGHDTTYTVTLGTDDDGDYALVITSNQEFKRASFYRCDDSGFINKQISSLGLGEIK